MKSDRTIFRAPFSYIEIVASTGAVEQVNFLKNVKVKKSTSDILILAKSEIEEYLAGERNDFSIPLNLVGTLFSKKVWSAISKVKYGKTSSYSDIARKISNGKAFRAVGTACGKNPIPLIIPCHRIVSSTGLGGYSGGLEIKKWLLNLENS